jgi:hypothetical protein
MEVWRCGGVENEKISRFVPASRDWKFEDGRKGLKNTKNHIAEVFRPFRTRGRGLPWGEGMNPFAGVCRPYRGWVEDSTALPVLY